MNTVFRMTKASLVLSFALVGVAAKAAWWLLEIIFDAGGAVDGPGYRHEVGGDEGATHTFDGRRIID